MLKRIQTGLIFFCFGDLRLRCGRRAMSNTSMTLLGRLTQVIDPSGNTATYNYDAVGNLLSITRSTTSPSGLAISSFAPSEGGVRQKSSTVGSKGRNRE